MKSTNYNLQTTNPPSLDRRLVYTFAVGGAKYREMALGLGRSLRLIGDDTPSAVVTDIDADWGRYFDHVIPHSGHHSFLDKMSVFDWSNADCVLALDCDSLVFRPLADVFDYCAGMPVAVQGDRQSTGTWTGADVAEICRRLGVESIARFNGGFQYYERGEQSRRLILRAREIEQEYAESGFDLFRGKPSDEVCIAVAMAQTGVGTVIPDETDFMSTAVGLVGKLRMDVRAGQCEFLCRRSKMRYIRPYIFHASRYSNFLIYWRQLARLRKWADGGEVRGEK